MKSQSTAKRVDIVRLSAALSAVLALWLLVSFAAAAASVPLTINVVGVGPNGATVAAPTVYRWTVEEDATKASVPGQAATSANYSFSFHTSYMPVVAAGRRCNGGPCTVPPAQAGDPDVARLYSRPRHAGRVLRSLLRGLPGVPSDHRRNTPPISDPDQGGPALHSVPQRVG